MTVLVLGMTMWRTHSLGGVSSTLLIALTMTSLEAFTNQTGGQAD